MTEFENDILTAAKKSVVKLFSDGNFITSPYENRYSMPASAVQNVYDLIDYSEVMAILKPKINQLVADRIVSALAQELTTDVKKVLSHEPTRTALREVVTKELGKLVNDSSH